MPIGLCNTPRLKRYSLHRSAVGIHVVKRTAQGWEFPAATTNLPADAAKHQLSPLTALLRQGLFTSEVCDE
jgi:hypothetical protein